MRKYIIISIAGLVLAGIFSYYIYRMKCQQVSAETAGQISSTLDTTELIRNAVENSRQLSSNDIESIPGLAKVISQDFGDLTGTASEFYRLSEAFLTSFHFGWLPGSGSSKNLFVLHAPTGIVYYAGYPVSMSGISGMTVTNQIQAVDDGYINPFKGWAPWASNLPYASITHTLAYAGVYWSDLEPKEGFFDFSAIEKTNQFDYCREHNIRLIIRVILDYPNKENKTQLPQWLYDKIGGDGQWYSTGEDRSGFSPNYENPVLIAAHRRMITELGRHYNQDPVIAFIQFGSLGHYGEWHVLASAGKMPSPAITSEYVRQYQSAFPDKVFLFRRPVAQMQTLLAGIYNDMIGDKEQTNRWLNWIASGGDAEFPDMTANPDFWQNGPSGGEFANGDPYRYLGNSAIAETRRQVSESHTSIIGPSSPTEFADSSVQANAQSLLQIMGYRFQIQSVTVPRLVKAGSTMTIRQVWQNLGNSPMYYNWPVQIQLRRISDTVLTGGQPANEPGAAIDNPVVLKLTMETDIRKWLPGKLIELKTTLRLPENLSAGRYMLSTAITDPATGLPGITLANAGRQKDGYYQVGQIQIH